MTKALLHRCGYQCPVRLNKLPKVVKVGLNPGSHGVRGHIPHHYAILPYITIYILGVVYYYIYYSSIYCRTVWKRIANPEYTEHRKVIS